MKILIIRGRNIASLEDAFELDFTSEPLASAGIFAITGSTGSGKSTILDTLCLALFDKTPRTGNAVENSIVLADVKDKTIRQDDSRALLRRGAVDGFAEAEFISLGGERYRSTWFVKRAWGKVDGALQPAEIKLMNLSSGREVQGRKTELLVRISELIGLTFEQFTRAVLLAQGDFATFLKSRQSEKAEILEKLTGTDIYSRISILIYEKTREAEVEYVKLRERVQGIILLPEEELNVLRENLDHIRSYTRNLKESAITVEAKIKWLIARDEISKSLSEAEAVFNKIHQQILDAAPRFAYIKQTEIAQGIRDKFKEHQQISKQLEDYRVSLVQKEKENEKTAALLEQSESDMILLEKEKNRIYHEWEQLEPAINHAKTLNIQIENTAANLNEVIKEIAKAKPEQSSVETAIATLRKETEDAQASVATIEEWFTFHGKFEQIVRQADLVVTLLDNLRSAICKRNESSSEREKGKAQILHINSRMEEIHSRLQSLGNQPLLDLRLASKALELRAELSSGLPCPVCGSTHHPAKNISEAQTREAAALNEEQKQLSAEMEKHKNAMTVLETLILNYENQQAEILAKLDIYLQNIPSWQEKFEQNSLQSELKKIAKQWISFEQKKNAAVNILQKNTSLILSEQGKLNGINENLTARIAKHESLSSQLLSLQAERDTLLQGQTIESLTQFHQKSRKSITEKIQKAADTKISLSLTFNTTNGTIANIRQGISAGELSLADLNATISHWIDTCPEDFTYESLRTLFTEDEKKRQKEKESLTLLEKQQTVAQATLEERKKQLEKHEADNMKPSSEETLESLHELLDKINAQQEQNNNRIAELNSILNNQDTMQKRMAALQKDLNATSNLYENWKKLNDLIGSSTGSKFKEIAQGYTLDALLSYANKHIQDLSGRYILQRVPETLGLQVVDMDMLGEIRTVHSLSGGESFLISLALALALSSLSSHRMNIESLFIDEGFGSLDIETLHIAMHSLESLQTQGRKIGVISHVPEMIEHIHTRIAVKRIGNGKSIVCIDK
jgi:exonuclease SbcC